MGKILDLAGQRFGRLVAQSTSEGTAKNRRRWLCACDCGKQHSVRTASLVNGSVQSCGCWKNEKSGERFTRYEGRLSITDHYLYRVWIGIRYRCERQKHPSYKHYGGRGITVCERWRESFEAFFEWARSSGYERGLSIERKDNDGPYAPENCTWIPRGRQVRNTRRTVWLEIDGVRKPLWQWAEEAGIDRHIVYARVIGDGWSPERALSTPIQERYRKGVA